MCYECQQEEAMRDKKEPTLKIDLVNHPPHYNTGKVECIDAIRSMLTDEEWRGFVKATIMQYVWRERYKGGAQDMGKVKWYIDRYLEEINAKEG